MNHSFAKYRVPVPADMHRIDVIFADADAPVVSRLARRVSTLGTAGESAAVCNTGCRATLPPGGACAACP